jgi:uncharacterized membrane protein
MRFRKYFATGLKIAFFAAASAVILASGTACADQLDNGDLFISADDVTSTAKFYPVDVDGTKMEIFAIKAPDGTVRTAFNTCQVCYGSGRGYYVQEGDVLVCQNCGNRFQSKDIEVVHGGCNPVPITADYKTVDSGGITIKKDFLVKAKVIFGRWKAN